jgi:hypothetical protein
MRALWAMQGPLEVMFAPANRLGSWLSENNGQWPISTVVVQAVSQ